MAETQVLEWVREAPFSDPSKLRTRPNFSYDEWFARGRNITGGVDALIGLLEKEDLQHPSGDGMRLTYALGWIGDRRQRAVEALVRSLDSSDIGLRIEAVSALGRIGNATVFPRLEKLVRDIHEDENVRGNACIAIGRLGDSSAEGVLRDAARDVDDFVVLCAEEGLRLLRNGGADRR
jgi:hypothetical protein